MKNNLYKNMKTNTITKKQQEDALPSMLSYLKFRFQKNQNQKKKTFIVLHRSKNKSITGP